MYAVPKTVNEAAELLNQVKPGWYNKIDLDNFNMSNWNKCILGQLYGEWHKGLKTLFGNENTTCIPFASGKYEWINLINELRNKEVKGNFAWAVQQLTNNKEVRRKCWHKQTKIHSNLNILYYDDAANYIFSLDDYTATDWEIFNPVLTLKDVQNGQTFKFKQDLYPLVTYRKASDKQIVQMTKLNGDACCNVLNYSALDMQVEILPN